MASEREQRERYHSRLIGRVVDLDLEGGTATLVRGGLRLPQNFASSRSAVTGYALASSSGGRTSRG